MNIELQANSKEIIGKDDRRIKLADGRIIETDLAVRGSRYPSIYQVARDAGLLEHRVNDYLQTSDPNIYAVGECSEHDGKVYGLVAPPMNKVKLALPN